jgi:hypothetical protein
MLRSNVILVVISLIAAAWMGFSGGFGHPDLLPAVVLPCDLGLVVIEVNTSVDVLSGDDKSGICVGGRFSVVLLLVLGAPLLVCLK